MMNTFNLSPDHTVRNVLSEKLRQEHPMRPLVKVCGMRDEANIGEVLNHSIRPDYLGFIFYEKSPRFVEHTLSEDFMRSLARQVATVGVFVNAQADDIVRAVERFNFHAVQLHGGETPEFCLSLQRQLQHHYSSVQIWKAFSIATKEDIASIVQFNCTINLALLDTKGLAHGGNGTRFDWTLLQYYNASMPFFLSGGIALEHSSEILSLYKQRAYPQLFGIDVNSKFEIAPALKDAGRVYQFLSQVVKS